MFGYQLRTFGMAKEASGENVSKKSENKMFLLRV